MAFLLDQFPRSLDIFQRYRTSEPETLFNSKQLADKQPLYWDDQTTEGSSTATSTYNANQASTTLTVQATVGPPVTRVRQTFRSFNYQSGKSHLIYMTGVLGTGVTGATRRMGYFNANNGLFLQLADSTLSVVRRTFTSGTAVDTVVTQANWNLDKLDGTGPSSGNPSGITLDTSKAQLFVIDFSWLGVGAVRFGFFLNGALVYCHQLAFGNSASAVYMSIPNLPLRYEIRSTNASTPASLVAICASVMSEGGLECGTERAIARDDTPLTTLNDAGLYPLIAIRLKSTEQFSSVRVQSVSVVCDSSATFRWMLLLNPTVTGTALSFTGIANSSIEADVARDSATKVTGGTQIATGYGRSTASAGGEVALVTPGDLQLGSSIAGVSDILVLAVQRMTVGGGAETFYGSLGWNESR